MSGFKILNIEVKDNDYLGDIDLQFVNLKETENGPYFSVIIGPNGTGKSNILRLIINLFRDLNQYKNTNTLGSNVPKRFGMEYSMNNKKFIYSNFMRAGKHDFVAVTNENPKKYYTILPDTKEGELKFNQNPIESLPNEDVVLPNKIIASSIMLTDKYPIINDKKESFEQYKYLGVRRLNSPGTAGTQTYINRTVEFIADSLNKPKFKEKIKDVLNFLELEEKFIIQFTPRYRSKIFTGNLDVKMFDDFFYKKAGLTRQTELWGKPYYEKMSTTEKQSVIDFCNTIVNNDKIVKPYEGAFSRVLEYDVMNNGSFTKDYINISHLRKLDLFSFPYFKVSKKGKEIDAEESSSGESHFISTLISIISNIEENSLILIDEPELSLHPNWQIKYIHFLNEIFKEYKSCHFIICTHSHFLISDLRSENSQIIGLNRTDELKVVDFGTNIENTYGWSAEEVLLKVFQVPTTRNYFVAEKLGEVLDLISKPIDERNEIEIKKQVAKLVEYNLDKLSAEDPLYDVIGKLIKRYA